MSARLKIIVAYDGSPFAGWQRQARGDTIQDRLEEAVQKICGRTTTVHGAGRTDAGVHALAQCAHFDPPDRRLTPDRWRSALNALLPAQIRIMRTSYVASSFHARFSATGKIYRYRIWNAAVLPPIESKRAWHLARELNVPPMVEAARLFEGPHNFSAFAANRGKLVESSLRTVRRVQVSRYGNLIALEFEADGFLYKMARMMAGTIVRIGFGKDSLEEVRQRLARARSVPKSGLVAPADGLFLVRVRY